MSIGYRRNVWQGYLSRQTTALNSAPARQCKALCGTLDCPACGIGFDGAQRTHTRYEVDAVLLMVDDDAKIATISSFRAETASRPALPPATPCKRCSVSFTRWSKNQAVEHRMR
jgi:hypothetical protein